MSQTAFGILMLGGLLTLCTGLTVWADWPNLKQKAQKLLGHH